MRRNTRRSLGGLSSAGQSAVGMGLLGVAVAAFDHFVKQQQTPGSATTPAPPPPKGLAPPDRMPGASAAPPPPPPPPRRAALSSSQSDAVLLIRAMIAAANADGVIDEAERKQILSRLDGSGLGSDERIFVLTELLAPKSLDAIVLETPDAERARMVFAASLCAIDVDTDAERDYIRRLGQALHLSAADIQEIEASLGES
jgi:uncharacterized membrane protein YebE (DUF533 family)